jgi:hypothetical protein
VPAFFEPEEGAQVAVLFFGMGNAAEVAERSEPRLCRRQSPPPVVVRGFREVRRDFLVKFTIVPVGADQGFDAAQKRAQPLTTGPRRF